MRECLIDTSDALFATSPVAPELAHAYGGTVLEAYARRPDDLAPNLSGTLTSNPTMGNQTTKETVHRLGTDTTDDWESDDTSDTD